MVAKKFGEGICTPDAHDPRDTPYADYCATLPPVEVPGKVDLQGSCPPVQTQHLDGSCVAQAVVSALEFLQIKEAKKKKAPDLSRLFAYYNARAEKLPPGNTVRDLGTSIRSAIKTVNKQGVCTETIWPYHAANVNVQPGPDCYEQALLRQLIEYKFLHNSRVDQLRDCLCRGFPFVFGMRYDDSNPSREGEFPGYARPVLGDDLVLADLAQHALMAVGYDDHTRLFKFLNSKGPNWGRDGYGYIDYDFITDEQLCYDFWMVRRIEIPELNAKQ